MSEQLNVKRFREIAEERDWTKPTRMMLIKHVEQYSHQLAQSQELIQAMQHTLQWVWREGIAAGELKQSIAHCLALAAEFENGGRE